MIGLHSIAKELVVPNIPVIDQNAIMSFIQNYNNQHPVWIHRETGDYGYYLNGVIMPTNRTPLRNLYGANGGWARSWLQDHPSSALIDWSMVDLVT
jgi:hypothetical protein